MAQNANQSARKRVSGHLEEKHDRYYIVLSLPNNEGKKKPVWYATGLPVKGNKTRANKMLAEACKNAAKGILPAKSEKKSKPESMEEENLPKLFQTDQMRPEMLYVDYLQIWLALTRPTIAETTFSGYKSLVDSRIDAYFRERGTRLCDLTKMDIKLFYATLQKQNLRARSITGFYAVVHKSLEDAAEIYRLIDNNPAAKIKRPSLENNPIEIYDADELTKILELFQGTVYEAPVTLAAFYGLRRSEVIGLRWSCVDFKRKQIFINHTVHQVKIDGETKIICSDKTKTKSSCRTLPLIPQVETMLLQVRKRQEKQKKICGVAYCSGYLDYICVDNMGNIVKPNTVSQRFRDVLKTTSLRQLHFKQLRHSCASLLLANGIGMKDIQAWLGHSHYSTTANYYARLRTESKQISADAISSILGNHK